MVLIKQHIHDFFDAVTYQRGQIYASEGRALIETVENQPEANKTTLKSKVQGSRWYRQSIAIKATPKLFIGGTCSCPVGYNCKHVVAVLLTYLDTPEPKETVAPIVAPSPNAFSQFLLSTKSNVVKKPFTATTGTSEKTHIVYVMKPGKRGSFDVQALRTRLLKTGEIAPPLPIGMGALGAKHYLQMHPYATLEDHDLANKVKTLPNADQSSHFYLYNTQGIEILNLLLLTDRLYWKELTPESLLKSGHDKKAEFLWRKREDGLTYFEILIDGRSRDLYFASTEPMIYVDTQTMTAGEVHHTLQPEVLDRLRQHPGIASEQLTEVSEALYLEFPHQPHLPLPSALTLEMIQVAPKPRLTLSAEMHNGLLRYQATLTFDYQGNIVAPDFLGHSVFAKINGISYEIKRDAAAEIDYRQALIPHGFAHAVRGSKGLSLVMDEHAPLPVIIKKWQLFLADGIETLTKTGWKVEFDPTFKLRFHNAEAFSGQVTQTHNDWFNVALGIEFNGTQLPLLPLIHQWLISGGDLNQQTPLLLNVNGENWLEIPYDVVKPIANTLIELFQTRPIGKSGEVQIAKHNIARLLELEETLGKQQKPLWQGATQWRDLAKKLRSFEGITAVETPSGLQAQLRDYQKFGMSWLCFIREYGFGGVLADDMGLGKTVQTLAYLQHLKQTNQLKSPALIVAPTSLMGNWRWEIERFTPSMTVLVWHGNDRHQGKELLATHDIIVASYGVVLRDIELLKQQPFDSVFLDEAQMVKNPKNKVSKAIRDLQVQHRFCLTGTPMENHLGELWSLFDFLMPSFLGDDRQFKKLYRTPIEKHGDHARHLELNKRILPFMLRRTKQVVAKELPPKTEMVRVVTLTGEQRKVYEAIRLSMESKVRDLLQTKGVARSHIEILDALLKLRQVCCDPRLVKLASAQKVHESAKLDLLMQMIPEMIEEGRSIILFSQFTSMLELIELELHKQKIPYEKLTGQTRNRDEKIQSFQQGKVKLFLISLKAGGFGLNLTAADTVIHYDPWWNPAVEMQATDRAHRIGQDKPVFVYKLIAEQTVEEHMLALQERKRKLAEGTYEGAMQSDKLELSGQELLALFKASPT